MAIDTTASSKVVAKSLMTESDAYKQILARQREKYGTFDFSKITNTKDRVMNTIIKRVQEISGRRVFRDFNRHRDYADFLGVLRLMAQSKTKWDAFEAEWGIDPNAFSSYYRIMGNLPWYNRNISEIVPALEPDWQHLEGYVMYMASKLGIVLDYLKFSQVFNEPAWEEWVEEAKQEIQEISDAQLFKEEEAEF